MPNYCDNVLTISGPYKDVMNFFNRFSRGESYFKMNNLIVPVSEDLASRIKAWGSKWDIGEVNPTPDQIKTKFEGYEDNCEEEIFQTIFYTTPWSPNDTFINNVSKMFETLIFTIGFYEPGNGFAGQYCYSNGEILEHLYYEKDLTYGEADRNTLCLAIDLELESAEYIVNDMYDEEDLENNEKLKSLIDYIAEKYNVEKYYEEDNNGGVLNLTSKLIEEVNLPDPE